MRREHGQAAVEWSATLLAVALALTGLAFVAARTDAWRLGDGVLHAMVCAVSQDCDAGEGALERAYGGEVATLVRRYAPNVAYERRSAQLPVDFRRCREVACANGPDEAADIDRSSAGLRVTAFTRVVDRRPSGPLYLQFWFYYPESFSGGIGRTLGPLVDKWPGRHDDDWESYQMRLGSGGQISARATAHGGYSSGWSPWTGWYRVSGGSHAGQIVPRSEGERRTPSRGVELVPLEGLGGLEIQRFTISPPWRKDVYIEPESASS
jgi:hypothetical protein